MYQFLRNLDRRWIFLLMAIAVGVPTLFRPRLPETPSPMTKDVFRAVDELPEGSNVLLAWDYDPSTEGELGPMATAFVRHCCERKHKLYFITLLPVGPQMINKSIDEVIKADFPDMVYGRDYVNLGFKSGYEGVIKVIITDLRGLYTTDAAGTNIDQIPMCARIKSVQDMKLIINLSGSYPGTKEWVQYAVTPYPAIKIVAGVTGVQAPLFYPYVPDQMVGMLGAIKGAAEYEVLVNDLAFTQKGKPVPPKHLVAIMRMGPQLVAHLLMIGLIIAGNIIFFWGQSRRRRGLPA